MQGYVWKPARQPVAPFLAISLEIFYSAKTPNPWIYWDSQELIPFCATNIVSSRDATVNGVYPEDILRPGCLLERANNLEKQKTSFEAMSFGDLCGPRYSVVVGFVEFPEVTPG